MGVEFPRSVAPRNSCRHIRVTGGNFRLLNRLLTQIQQILEINTLEEVSKTPRESLVIGQV